MKKAHSTGHSVADWRLMLTGLIIAVLFSHGLPAISADSKTSLEKKIETLKKEYEDSKQKVETGKKHLKENAKQKKDALNKLTSTEKDIKSLNNTLITIRNKERRLEREIVTSRGRLVKTENELSSQAEMYAVKVRSLYVRQRVSPVGLIMSGLSMSSIMRGLRVFAALAHEDMKLITSIRSTSKTIETTMKSLSQAKKAERSLERKRKSDLISLEKKKSERSKWLDQIVRDTELTLEEVQKNEREMAAIEAERLDIQKQIAKQVSKRAFTANLSDELRNYNFPAKKGRLSWPADGRIVSKFGLVTDPKTKTKTRNRGIEIETRFGDPVKAIGHGVVMQTMYMRGYGNLVWLYHHPNHYTIYAHLGDIFVEMGAEIHEGDVIGSAGSSGLYDDSQSRLRLEIINGKIPENPLSWLTPDKGRLSKR